MKHSKSRRIFIRNLSLGAFSTILTFGFFKSGNASSWLNFDIPGEKLLPRINPAFRMNIFNDGTVELFTHKSAGDRIAIKFEGLQADILIKILNETDPLLCFSDLGNKYNLRKESFATDISKILKSLEDKGFVYYGEQMQVKIVKVKNG
jgi:hypothetical protein